MQMQDNINILNELKEAGSTILLATERRNIYVVPADYFNSFPQNLLSRIFVESILPVNLYTVPVGYFDRLPELILEKISVQMDFEEINRLEKMPYSVPDGYFNTLAKSVLEKIKAHPNKAVQEELKEIAP